MTSQYQIIGQHSCVYCELACARLEDLDIPYKYRSLNPRLKRFLRRRGYTTVPQIWRDGIHIGGYNELVKHLDKLYSKGV
jgi:glutaredoxin